mgnify:CR=1 FL=1
MGFFPLDPVVTVSEDGLAIEVFSADESAYARLAGLKVVIPSNPYDAKGLMISAIRDEDPVVFMEPKLLSEEWLEFLGSGGRDTVAFDVPADGAFGAVPPPPHSTPFAKAVVRREGTDVTIVAVAVGVHRALEAAAKLQNSGVSCEVIDLRSLRPLDVETIVESVTKTGRLLVVDEDYREFGLAGEMAAICLEASLSPRFARVCVEDTLPYARHLEDAALPNVHRIIEAATHLADA